MNITEMVELFQKNRVPYLRNHILNPPNNHNAIISQWGRWWIEDTNNLGSNRGIFDEAIECEGRRADIMFLEQSADKIFKIKGVAEIENNINDDEDKYREKLGTLTLYDKSTEKFPDLKFAILSALMVIDKNNTAIDFFTPLLEDIRNHSKDSRLSWIIFLLFKVPYTTEYQEVNTPHKLGSKTTIFGRYMQEGAYAIFKEGKELNRINWPIQ
ncbi:MAG: hypothetical protein O8C62_06745 [Candidatus Methanoperedens sp.]|nr:hypothetical protein [Candidatus Methanoperedens sp.]